jgi:hypothetical protein
MGIHLAPIRDSPDTESTRICIDILSHFLSLKSNKKSERPSKYISDISGEMLPPSNHPEMRKGLPNASIIGDIMPQLAI